MLRRTASVSSLPTISSLDQFASPYTYHGTPHQQQAPRRRDYHRIDPLRSAEPVFCPRPTAADVRPYRAFMAATAHTPVVSTIAGPPIPRTWLTEHTAAGLATPWVPPEKDAAAPARRPGPLRRARQALVRHPVVPLVLRIVVWVFALAALILGAQLWRDHGGHPTSPVMAVVVDAVALLYLIWVARDEWGGGQVGVRAAGEKVRLLLLDLFFIVFGAANLALAMDALADGGAGTAAGGSSGTAGRAVSSTASSVDMTRQRGLAAVLLVALITWMMTFSVSAIRLVEKAAGAGYLSRA